MQYLFCRDSSIACYQSVSPSKYVRMIKLTVVPQGFTHSTWVHTIRQLSRRKFETFQVRKIHSRDPFLMSPPLAYCRKADWEHQYSSKLSSHNHFGSFLPKQWFAIGYGHNRLFFISKHGDKIHSVSRDFSHTLSSTMPSRCAEKVGSAEN